MNKGLLIFIRGIPGSGKSYLASKISLKYNFTIIDPEITLLKKDYIREETAKYRINLSETISNLNKKSNVCWCQPWRKVANIDLTIRNINYYLKNKLNNIFDMPLQDLKEVSPFNFVILELQEDPVQAFKRVRNKFKNECEYNLYINKFQSNTLNCNTMYIESKYLLQVNNSYILENIFDFISQNITLSS